LNGYILNVETIIKNMVASAAESEVGACFQNAQSGAPIRVTIIELGNNQHVTPLKTDNSKAFEFLNATIKQRSSKAVDMIYTIGSQIESAKNNLMSIGAQVVKIWVTITHRNITKICSD
jgi:hypothetical protein